MNLKLKIAIVCALIVGLTGIYWTTSRRSLPTYTYSEFLGQVSNNRVASVVVTSGNEGAVEATVHLKDGAVVRTVLPSDYKDALRAMQEKLVNIEISGSSSEPIRLLINMTPFLVLVGIWFVLMTRKFPNGFKQNLFG